MASDRQQRRDRAGERGRGAPLAAGGAEPEGDVEGTVAGGQEPLAQPEPSAASGRAADGDVGEDAGAAEDRPDAARPAEESDDDVFVVAGMPFRSRLILGTGKYPSNEVMVSALRASGAQMITVAVRRVDLDRSREEGVLHHLDSDEFFLLANTAGCFTAEEAVRYARLARSAGFNEWLKLEVIGDERTLLPDTHATVEAARILVDEGFKVMAYTSDDVVTALRLEDAGCVAVMPLASPIGSGLGVVNPYFIREIKRRLDVPVIVDAGVGTASDACIAMEQGIDGVLMNTAIAAADDPVRMAEAMRHAVEAGRLAFLAGRMQPQEIAVPSSPTRGLLD